MAVVDVVIILNLDLGHRAEIIVPQGLEIFVVDFAPTTQFKFCDRRYLKTSNLINMVVENPAITAFWKEFNHCIDTNVLMNNRTVFCPE